MGRLRNYVSVLRLVTVQSQTEDILAILKKHEAEAVDLNLEQLKAGKTSQGDDIAPAYTPFTIEIKKAKGQHYDRVTLLDEGDFHRSFFMKAEAFPVLFDAKDEKRNELVFKYGQEIFGLSKESLSRLNQDYLREAIQAYYRDILLLQ